jgi:hypothetical protein
MAEKLDPKEFVSFKEMLMANSIQADALSQLLIEKGIISEEEFFGKLKEVMAEYQDRQRNTSRRKPDKTTAFTLGSAGRKMRFTYTGNVPSGTTLDFTGNPCISADFFQAILAKFDGLSVPGGFSMTNPKPGGLGEWVAKNSSRLNPVQLTPRHASFIAAILDHEGYISSSLDGNAVILHFKKK